MSAHADSYYAACTAAPAPRPALRGPVRADVCIVGGGSRNEFLNSLTAEASGLPVERCSPESSTLGNFALQCARLETSGKELDAASITRYARQLLPVL